MAEATAVDVIVRMREELADPYRPETAGVVRRLDTLIAHLRQQPAPTAAPAHILQIAESFYDQTVNTAGAYTMEPGPEEPQALIRRREQSRVTVEGEQLMAYLRGASNATQAASVPKTPEALLDRELIASAIQAGRYGGRLFPASNPLDFRDADRIIGLIETSLAEHMAQAKPAPGPDAFPTPPAARAETADLTAATRTVVAAAQVCFAYVNGDNLIEVENRYRECTKVLLRAATEPRIARWVLNTEAHMGWVRALYDDSSPELVAALQLIAESE